MDLVRCPYCIAEDNFKPMDEQRASGAPVRFICRKCGHMVQPDDKEFTCQCAKCRAARFPGRLDASRAS